MELDEMKRLWQTQHAKPATSHKRNGCPATCLEKRQTRLSIAYPYEQDAERAASDKSSGYLATILRNEYTRLAFVIVLLVALLFLTDRALASAMAMTGFIILLFSLLLEISVIIYTIALLKQIDPAVDSIADCALKIDRLHLVMISERLIGLSLIPFNLISLYLVIDGYQFQQLIDILPRLIISIILAIAISYFLYKKSYFKKITTIKEHIKDIKDFQNSV